MLREYKANAKGNDNVFTKNTKRNTKETLRFLKNVTKQDTKEMLRVSGISQSKNAWGTGEF